MGTAALRGRTVLVTGGAGFIGSHLVEALAADCEVRVVDDLSRGRREYLHPDATFIEGSLCDGDTLARAMGGVDVVFHLAASGAADTPADGPCALDRATLDLFERAREEDARVVVASSTAVYGDPEALPVCEEAPLSPLSAYGAEKCAVDCAARRYYERYGLETVVLRYFNVYGPRQACAEYSSVITTFLEQACAGQPLTVAGDGSQVRDFVHVSDVVAATLLAATTDAVGEAFNVGTGRSTTLLDLARLVCDLTGAPGDLLSVSDGTDDVTASRADISKARDRLGYAPTVGLTAGLTDLVA
ncbi:NAD-dependent epimerase/dehydratase family protein [Halomarina litorea]|uniref:NAD-dependent epimerase/dehydratase family protein n=1 Tax=Halomarina litorea TaxID=2961595 RepID=UPI0020C51B76|nr:NAD-dependent epimerase/dehydratase family protein [Halomarina sp. BCD28]